MDQSHLESMFEHRLLGPTPRVSDSTVLEGDHQEFSANQLPGHADAAGPGVGEGHPQNCCSNKVLEALSEVPWGSSQKKVEGGVCV